MRVERALRDMPFYPLECLSRMPYRCEKRELAKPYFLLNARRFLWALYQ